MKRFFATAPLAVLCIGLLGYWVGVIRGYNEAKRELPSCLYLRTPPGTPVRPWGCDGKEGVFVNSDDISGGGIYVSLEEWKRGK
jgi:hypothetical protein